MHDVLISAFTDELVKIAVFQKLRQGFTNLAREGWEGTPEQIRAGEGATWFGQGRNIKPGMGPLSRRFEELTSLGGATRALPVGGKSLMLLGTGMTAREALRPVDPTGQARSRSERLSGLVGDTMGGLVGSALGHRFRPGLAGSMIGGALGSMVGSKITTTPFEEMRHHRMGMQQQAAQPMQQPQMSQYQGVSA